MQLTTYLCLPVNWPAFLHSNDSIPLVKYDTIRYDRRVKRGLESWVFCFSL